MIGFLDRLTRLRILPRFFFHFTVRPALLALLLAAPAAGNDPPYRMTDVTPASNHLTMPGQGLWGYADANGEYALVTTGSSLAVIDVTDPAHPVLASRVLSTGADIKEVKTYRHYAFCANQQGPVQIVDLSDPYHAYTAANYMSERITGCHNLWVEEDGYAYLALQGTGPQDLRILDLNPDPLHPTERGWFTLPDNGGYISAHDVYVRNDTCYVSWFGGGLVILDVRDKDSPLLLQHAFYPQAATHNAWPTLDGRFVCTTDEQSGGHLRIWDIDGRFGVNQVAEYMTEAEAIIHNVHLKGNTAYIAYYTAGVRVVDLTDPVHPLEIGRFDTSRVSGNGFGGVWSVFPYAPSGLIYASDMERGFSGGLYVLRFLDAGEGVLRGTLRVHSAEAARVAGAEVRFLESEIRVVSDRAGYFQANLGPGNHTAQISAPGFHPETFTASVAQDDVTNVTIVLDPLPGAAEFVEGSGPPVALPDGRLALEARVRAHGWPITEVTLRYRAGSMGSFRALSMQQLTADDERYRAFVPELLSGTLVQYFFEAEDAGGSSAFLPADAPAGLFSHRVGQIDWQPVFTADFESDGAGFTVGAADDRGTQGFWERAIPIPNISPAQPHTDTSDGGPGYCFLTDLGKLAAPPLAHEVDGRTTLTSPPVVFRDGDFAAGAARLRLLLWYVNGIEGNQWQDPFLIEGSTDGGSSWRVLEAIRITDTGWQEVTIDLGQRLDLRTGRVQIRFVAQDDISPTLVEAAIDDVRIEVTSGVKVQEIAGRPEVVLLRQNTPNPFNPSTTISYQLKEQRPVRLAIYDAMGHLVRILTDRVQPVGDHAVTWDGRDVRGVGSPSGLYYYKFDAREVTETRRMLLLK